MNSEVKYLRDDLSTTEWDAALAVLGGHPLQSALWGDARQEADGIADLRWMGFGNGQPLQLMRIERRKLPGGGWVGWLPRGPVGALPDTEPLPAGLRETLRREGMVLLVTDRWEAVDCVDVAADASQPRTIWIDLSTGHDAVWKGLDKQWRYGVGRARRLGVTVDCATEHHDVDRFFSLCESVAEKKDFVLPGSAVLMKALLERSGPDVEARLFLARSESKIASGVFVIRCGRSLHYFWGATDRVFAKLRASEAVQWAAVEWGLSKGCTLYDLEGIDPVGNPGTYGFKKKMGGEEVTLAGKHYCPTGFRGRIVAWLDAHRR